MPVGIIQLFVLLGLLITLLVILIVCKNNIVRLTMFIVFAIAMMYVYPAAGLDNGKEAGIAPIFSYEGSLLHQCIESIKLGFVR